MLASDDGHASFIAQGSLLLMGYRVTAAPPIK
jgi:hypothetical protein